MKKTMMMIVIMMMKVTLTLKAVMFFFFLLDLYLFWFLSFFSFFTYTKLWRCCFLKTLFRYFYSRKEYDNSVHLDQDKHYRQIIQKLNDTKASILNSYFKQWMMNQNYWLNILPGINWVNMVKILLIY